MTRIIITLLASILSLLLHAQESPKNFTSKNGVTLTVEVNNISSNKGKGYFSLFNSEENFYNKISFQSATGEINENKTTIVFENVPKGSYAITCFHDANDNKQMDFDGFMPIEDYGVSNNSRSMGPPQYKPAKFKVEDANLNLEIKF